MPTALELPRDKWTPHLDAALENREELSPYVVY
jgi:hypothetical protein